MVWVLGWGFLCQDIVQGFGAKKIERFPNKCDLKFVGTTEGGLFAWEATWRKVLTLDHIQRRWWPLANKCFLCLKEEESVDHIIFHCVRTRVLCHFLFSLFGVSWLLPSLVREALLRWHGFFVGTRRGRLLLYAFFGLFRRKEIVVGHLTMRGGWFKGWNSPLFVIFGLGVSCK